MQDQRKRSSTTQDELWMMLQKERPRYLERNIYQEEQRPPKRLKSPTLPKPGGLSLFSKQLTDEELIMTKEDEILFSDSCKIDIEL